MFMVTNEMHLDNIILVAIMRQKDYFSKDIILVEVCKAVLPPKAQKLGYYPVPTNPIYRISPDVDFIHSAIARKISELVSTGKLKAKTGANCILYAVAN